jgi:hypothetical protein
MKTIEKAAKKYAGISEDKYSNKALKYCSFDISDAFKAGVEFAQRWIPVEEELPKRKLEDYHIILKGENKFEVIRHIKTNMFTYEIENLLFGYTHWRPIEIK